MFLLWIGMIPVLIFFASSVIFFTLMVWLIGRQKKSIASIALTLLVVCCIVSTFYFIF
ncbi:MAG: hypothetical protein JXB42_00200 [Deltaproteobacteria bacterium]|nr:hypothetical protein [Deltaproteobacteria bacterium]